MRYIFQKEIKKPQLFKHKLLSWGNKFEHFALLDSNHQSQAGEAQHLYCSFDLIAGAGAIKSIDCQAGNSFTLLKKLSHETNDWLLGFLSYDLKNETEALSSNNFDGLGFPDMHFFQPEYLITLNGNKMMLHFYPSTSPGQEGAKILEQIENSKTLPDNDNISCTIKPRITSPQYIDSVEKIIKHIHRGDIFQLNFCQEFYAENAKITPGCLYKKLTSVSPTPFSCYYKKHGLYALSASPERFIKKQGHKVLSQPMKGTIKRGEDSRKDKSYINELLNDPKEKAENTMIVDLVRNDLSHTAIKGSVKVEELYGIYTYPQVHQMVSTIISSVGNDIDPVDIIKEAFPMGSMTGAPKVRAMELIEKYESTRRGLYSGAIGYITPEKDFDFNVVIRTILYNALKKYLSFSVGGAITSYSIPVKEYDECMLKALAMQKALNILPKDDAQ